MVSFRYIYLLIKILILKSMNGKLGQIIYKRLYITYIKTQIFKLCITKTNNSSDLFNKNIAFLHKYNK